MMFVVLTQRQLRRPIEERNCQGINLRCAWSN